MDKEFGRIVVVDDHPFIVDALRQLLKEVFPSADIAGFNSIEDFFVSPGLGFVDLLILDVMLPLMSGIDALPIIFKRYPSAMIVVLSGTEDARVVSRLRRSGVTMFIPKTIAAGLLRSAFESIKNNEFGSLCFDVGIPTLNKIVFPVFTDRQLEVISLVARGLSNKEIASVIGVAEITVKKHLSSVFRLAGVRSRLQLLNYINKIGYTSLGNQVEKS